MYISDLIKFVELVIRKQKKKYEIYNCGSETGIKILDLAKLIIKITGKNIKIKKNFTAPTIKFNLVLDCKKAKKEIGWKSKVSLSEGIKKTLIWWKKINLNNVFTILQSQIFFSFHSQEKLTENNFFARKFSLLFKICL